MPSAISACGPTGGFFVELDLDEPKARRGKIVNSVHRRQRPGHRSRRVASSAAKPDQPGDFWFRTRFVDTRWQVRILKAS
jgi:hypothetical protein